MDNHQYFKKQPLDKLKNDIPNIHFNCNEIKSIQTTNQNCVEEDNVLLQFIDLILGGAMNCLHYTGKKNKEKIALKLVNVIKESLKPSWNSKYRKVYNISFFPKHKLDENDGKIEKEKKYNENYYKNRELKILNRNQIIMFEFLDQLKIYKK